MEAINILNTREKINKEIEDLVRKKIFDSNSELNMVYTLGVGVTYDRMIELMDFCNNCDDNEGELNVYVVVGSDERTQPCGFVFDGAYDERMFFGILGGNPTIKSHPLEDVNSVAEEQKWCVGKIEFGIEEELEFRNDVVNSLIRSYISFFKS